MSADSFAKIDMSLDDIIKLNKKEKREEMAAKKQQNKPGNKLTVAQRKRAELLKLKAKNKKMNITRQQGGQGTRGRGRGRAVGTPGRATQKLRMDMINKRSNIVKRQKISTTRGGSVSAARKRQMNAEVGTTQRQRFTRGKLQIGKTYQNNTNFANSQNTRNARSNNRQKNQKQQRQNILDSNRRGRPRGRGRGGVSQARTLQVNVSTVKKQSWSGKNVQRTNRQYNQQPRRGGAASRQATRGGRGRGSKNKFTQQTSRRNSVTNVGRRGKGNGRRFVNKERSVTLY